MPVRGSQYSVDVRKFWIGLGGEARELNRLFVSLRQQGGPTLAKVPNDQQRISRAEPDRLVEVQQGGIVVAAKGVAYAEISARKYRVRIDIDATVAGAAAALTSATESLTEAR